MGEPGQRTAPERGIIMDRFGLIETDRGLGQGIIVSITDRPDRGPQTRKSQYFNPFHRRVLSRSHGLRNTFDSRGSGDRVAFGGCGSPRPDLLGWKGEPSSSTGSVGELGQGCVQPIPNGWPQTVTISLAFLVSTVTLANALAWA